MKENERISSLTPSEWAQVRNKYHISNKGMDLEIAAKILFEVDEILKSLNVRYFISCGTALGFYRDGEFISWDDEIDIDIYSEVFAPQLEKIREVFIDHGFVARATFRGATSKMAVFKNGIKVAMGAVYDGGDGYRHTKDLKCPNKFYDNAENFIFCGRDFLIPAPIEEYLSYYYGNWKIPIKSYNPDEYINMSNELIK